MLGMIDVHDLRNKNTTSYLFMNAGVTLHVTPTHSEHGMERGKEREKEPGKEAWKHLHFAQNRYEASDQVLVTELANM
jgi:hypothetical protein